MAEVRTRFAPSPTGSLHVGGVRTALYTLLHARHHGGTFVLRIEDTDQARSTEASTLAILRDMRWLGLLWDEGPGLDDEGPYGPYKQSERLDLYNRYAEQLLSDGAAYLAYESREELGAMRDEAMAAKRNFRFKRLPYTEAQIEQFKAEGRVPVVRLAAPTHDVTVHDAIEGDVTVTEADLEDIVIRKADGFPTYHFAVVVDDHLMGITDAHRGKEHMLNTHKHFGICEALGWTLQRTGHMPTILNPGGGGKMSKRDKAKAARAGARIARDARKAQGLAIDSWAWLAEAAELDLDDVARFMKKKHDGVPTAEAIAGALDLELPNIEVMDFRKAGYTPEAILNYLALLGWSPGDDREIMTLDEMAEAFTIERVGRANATFDPDKLRWMNGEYMRSLPIERLLELHKQYVEVVPDSVLGAADPATRSRLLTLYAPRARTFAELDQAVTYVFQAPEVYDAKAVKKWLLKGAGLQNLALARETLAGAEWTEAGLDAAVQALIARTGLGMGKVAQPLRVAISGSSATPGLFETLTLFSQDEALRRVDACLQRVTA